MSDSEDEDRTRSVKITFVGETSTGKSSVCARYLGGVSAGGGTQGAEVLAGQCLGLRPPVPLQLCDVAGNALATDMLANYLYASDIVVFVYDLTNLQSFDKLSVWVETVKDIFANESKKPLMALFGNKSDLEHQRAVRLSVVDKFASEHLLETFKGSARTGEMVQTSITNLVATVLGKKVRRLPAISNGKATTSKSERNGRRPSNHSPNEPRQSLIMNRIALRKLNRRESSVCRIN